MKFRKLMALTLAAFLTIGSIPMEYVRAAEPDMTDEASLEMSAVAEESFDEAGIELSKIEGSEEDVEDAEENSDDAGKEAADGDIDAPAQEETVVPAQDEDIAASTVEEEAAEAVRGDSEEAPEAEEEPELLGEYAGISITLNGNGGQIRTGYDYSTWSYTYADTLSLAIQSKWLYNYTPKREGWWFTGWYDGPDTSKARFLSLNSVDDLNAVDDRLDSLSELAEFPEDGAIIYAGWEKAATLDFNGGTWKEEYGIDDFQTYTLTERTADLGSYIPTREGWFFTGWYADKACTKKLSSESDSKRLEKYPAAISTIYAGWTKDVFTVTYVFGDEAIYKGRLSEYGEVSKVEVRVPGGQKLLNEYVPEVDWFLYEDLHYSFDYWADSSNKKVTLTDYTVTGNVTFTAQYKKDKIVVTFDYNGGYVNRTQSMDGKEFITRDTRQMAAEKSSAIFISGEGANSPKNDDPRKRFKEWTYDKAGKKTLETFLDYELTIPDNNNTNCYIATGTADFTLYAQWEDTNCILTLDPNASDGFFQDGDTLYQKVKTKKYGAAKGENTDDYLYTPVRDDKHYRFTGWYSDKECKNQIVAADGIEGTTYVEYTLNSDETWYAGWKKDNIVITFDAREGYFDYEPFDEHLGERTGNKAQFIVQENGKIYGNIYNVKAKDTNKNFEGWYIGNTRIEDIDAYVFTADITVTARYASHETKTDMVITGVEGEKLDGTLTICTGEEYTLKAYFGDKMGTFEDAQWKSSDTSVVEVTVSDDGYSAMIRGVGEGKAKIIATSDSKTASLDVEVYSAVMFAETNLFLTAVSGAVRDTNVLYFDYTTWNSIKAYTSDDCKTESDLVKVEASGTGNPGGDDKISMPVSITPTAKGLAITEAKTITLVATVTMQGKTYTGKSTLTLSPRPQVGAITSSTGAGYIAGESPRSRIVPKGTRVFLYCDTPGTEIYYTTDKSTPSKAAYDAAAKAGTLDKCATKLFGDAIAISKSGLIKAYAVKTSGTMRDSEVYVFNYAFSLGSDLQEYNDWFSGSVANVPEGVWYIVGDKYYSDLENGVAVTEFKKTYTGSKITFNSEIKVFEGTRRLIENHDYTISYSNNVNVAGADAVKGTKSIAPTVIIKGKGNYTKSASLRFTIDPASILMTQAGNGGTEYAAAGTKLSNVKPALKYNGKKLTLGKDYVITYFRQFGGSFSGEITNPSEVVLEKDDIYFIRISGKEGSNFDPTSFGPMQVVAIDKKNTVTANKLKIVDAKGKPLKVKYTGEAIHLTDLLLPDKNGAAKAYIADGKKLLPYGEGYYAVTEYDGINHPYLDNYTDAGVHYVSVNCFDEELGGKIYSGSASLSFEITGKDLKSVKIAGLSTTAEYNLLTPVELTDLFNSKDKTIIAQNNAEEDPSKKWDAVTLYTTTTQKDGKKKVTVYDALTEGTDYEVSWENNTGLIGKCNLIFTGKGKYTGSIKKVITVKSYNLNDANKGSDSKIRINVKDAVYSKTGAKPNVTVSYDGTKLREGIDYTLSYKNAGKLCEDYNEVKASSRPVVVVKGKGNYSGSNATAYFNIKKANIANDVTMQLSDVVRDPRNKSMFKLFSVPKFLDNGKALSFGKNADIDDVRSVCTYAEDTELLDGKRKYAGDFLNSYDMVPGGTLIKEAVTVTINPVVKGSKGRTKESMYFVDDPGYSTTITGYYRIVDEGMDIGKMAASIKSGVTYAFHDAQAVIPLKTTDIQVSYKVKGQKAPVYLDASDFEILSVTNNKLVGTATVTIRGKGKYGGTKTINFKITSRNIGD